MGNETTALKSPASGRRASANGRQVVGDYTGQRAGDAAQAVRRAGLRPGLERSFGCDPSLLGLIVSQEPAAGSALARNGMVTLHVAAPGNPGATDEGTPVEPTPGPAEPLPTSQAASAPADVEREREPLDAAGVARRRRKPGLAGRTRLDFDTPPAPRAPTPSEPVWEDSEAREAPVEPDPAVEVDGWEFSEETSEEDLFDGLTAEEFVVHVDDVFAGRTGRWRPAHRPRRARIGGRGRVSGRLAAHPWLAGCAAFAIGLWVLVAIFGALAGRHPALAHRTSSRLTARAPIARTEPARRSPVERPAPRRREIARPTIARRPTVLPRPRAHAPARRASAVRPVVRTPAPAASAPVAPTPAAAGVPVQASEPAAPPPPPAEQQSGGQFSP